MTIANAFSSALSGLTAASKAAELVSSNIANATTAGYARRTLNLTSQAVYTNGQGVRIVGTNRVVNQPLISDRRLAQAEQGGADAVTAFYQRIETTIGTPDQAYSLSGRVAALNSALTEAASHPESEPRLTAVGDAARTLVSGIAAIGKDIQSARTAADTEIGAEVRQLNDALQRADQLNLQIRRGNGAGTDTSALQDQRQQVVDQIAQIVPLREMQNDDGSVSLYTTNGGVLLDTKASVFGFSTTAAISPAMTLQSGGLSGLTLNGRAIPTSGESSPILGGSLAANFAIRDDLGVSAQAQIDGVARDLVERFQDPNVDSTQAPGDPGLFTDSGAAFDPANEVGLAQRLSLNAAADPTQGGAIWRLRDGLGATAPGNVGDSTLLSSLNAAFTSDRTPVSGGFMAGARSFSVLASDLLSSAASSKLTAQGQATYAATRLNSFTAMEAQGAVDTDQEMQSLLQVEQSYAANAKVMKTVDDMIQRLLDM
ncbi:flagellar hook-associated protein FlgK [bacterium]|nr:flagellar hook-associated protein FlgK [bacterium]